MNRIFRVVWSKKLGRKVVASELAQNDANNAQSSENSNNAEFIGKSNGLLSGMRTTLFRALITAGFLGGNVGLADELNMMKLRQSATDVISEIIPVAASLNMATVADQDHSQNEVLSSIDRINSVNKTSLMMSTKQSDFEKPLPRETISPRAYFANQKIYHTGGSNTSSGSVWLKNTNLSNTVLQDPKNKINAESIDSKKYNYVSFLFRPEFTSSSSTSADYTFFLYNSPVDSVMILYQGAYNPNDPAYGALVGNDDTTNYNNSFSNIGTPHCGDTASSSRCPGVTATVNNGEVYTVWVSTFDPSVSASIQNGTNSLVIGTNAQSIGGNIGSFSNGVLTSIEGAAVANSYDLGFKIKAEFNGGTLRLWKPESLGAGANSFEMNQKFTLSNSKTNTLDTNGKDATFRGIWSNLSSNQPGIITLKNSSNKVSNITFTANNTFTGGMTIGDKVNVILKDGKRVEDNQTSNAKLGTGYIDIAKGGSFRVQGKSDYALVNELKGQGTVFVSLLNSTNQLTISTPSQNFSGDFVLEKGTLTDSNWLKLNNKAMRLKIGNAAILQNSKSQTIAQQLEIDGGSINLKASEPLTVEQLLVTNKGATVNMTLDKAGFKRPDDNFIAQSQLGNKNYVVKSNQMIDLKAAGAIKSNIKNSSDVTMSNGQVTLSALENGMNNTKDLSAIYTMKGQQLTLDATGIGYEVQLTKLISQSNALLSAKTLTGSQKMNAELTGKGGYTFEGNKAGLLLTQKNSYQGNTEIRSGKVIAGSNDSLGSTAQLTIIQDATFDLQDKTQTIGDLQNEGILTLNGGTLNITKNGKGSGKISGQGTLNLSEQLIVAQDYDFRGVINLESGGHLVFGDQGTFSDTNLTIVSQSQQANAIQFDNNQSVVFNGKIKGSSGLLISLGTGNSVTITSEVLTSGSHLVKGGDLRIGNGRKAATIQGNIHIDNADSSLIFDQGDAETIFTHIVSGTGKLENRSGTLTLTANNTHTGGTSISGGKLIATNNNQLGNGSVQIGSKGVLFLNQLSEKQFNQKLSGNGLLSILGSDSAEQFTFGDQVGNQFAGMVVLENLTLSSKVSGNRQTLNEKTNLTLNNGTVLNVHQNIVEGDVRQQIDFKVGHMVLNQGSTLQLGGTLAFNPIEDGTLTVKSLMNKGGLIDINLHGTSLGNSGQGFDPIEEGDNLTAEQIFKRGVMKDHIFDLIHSDSAITELGEIKINGEVAEVNAPESSFIKFTRGLTQTKNGVDELVAKVLYAEGVTTQKGVQYGLFVTSGVHSIDILEGKNLAIATDGVTEGDFKILLTGEGALTLDASKTNPASSTTSQVMNFGDSGNSYAGGTTVTGGTIRLIAEESFGLGSLVIQPKGQVDLNGQVQTLTKLENQSTQGLLVNGGLLTIQGSDNTLGNLDFGTDTKGNIVLLEDNEITANQSLKGQGMITVGVFNRNDGADNEFLELENAYPKPSKPQDSKGLLTISATENQAFSGQFKVDNGRLNIANREALGGLGNASIILSNQGSFTIHLPESVSGRSNSDEIILNNRVIAEEKGVVEVDLHNNTLTLGDRFTADSEDFKGILSLSNTHFVLNQTQAKHLVNGQLQLNAGSNSTISESSAIHSLLLQGGTLNFGDQETHTLTLNHFEIDTKAELAGTIEVADRAKISAQTIGSILDMSNSAFTHTLILSDNAVDANALDHLKVMVNGQQIIKGESPEQEHALKNVGSDLTVATGVYNYNLTEKLENTGSVQNGLFIGYELTKIALSDASKGDQALVISNETGTHNILNATVTGNGDLVFQGKADQAIVLAKSNEYTGNTTIKSGIVQADAHQVLGNSERLIVAKEATFDLAGQQQTLNTLNNSGQVMVGDNGQLMVNSIDNDTAGVLNLAKGTLTIKGDTLLSGLTGSGTVVLAGGTSNVKSDNRNDLTATIKILDKATLNLHQENGLGIGNMIVAGILNLGANGQVVANTLSGNGQIIVGEDATLSANNDDFRGKITISSNKSLSITDINQLGSAQVTLSEENSQLRLNHTDEMRWVKSTLVGKGIVVVGGSSDSTVNTEPEGILSTLLLDDTSVNNEGFTGTFEVTDRHRLVVNNARIFGKTTKVDLKGDASVYQMNYAMGNLTTNVVGDGLLQLGENSQDSNIVPNRSASLTVLANDASNNSNHSSIAETVKIALTDNAVLTYHTQHFNHSITGSGLLNINAGFDSEDKANHFTLGDNVGQKLAQGAFTGTLALQVAQFELDQRASGYLQESIVRVHRQAQVDIASGDHQIKGLELAGGQLNFTVEQEDLAGGDRLHLAGNIHLSDQLLIQAPSDDQRSQLNLIVQNGITIPDLPTAEEADGLSIFQLDDGKDLGKVISTTNGIQGDINHLQLLINGEAVSAQEGTTSGSEGIILALKNDGQDDVAAEGRFNFTLAEANERKDLHVTFSLAELNLIGHTSESGDGTAFIVGVAEGATEKDANFKARITGKGDLILNNAEGNNTIASFSNSDNDYEGKTIVQHAHLRLNANHTLGKTSLLTIHNKGIVDLNQKQQTVGALHNQGQLYLGSSAGSTTGMNDDTSVLGQLIITNQDNQESILGQVEGSGTITVNQGLLTLNEGGKNGSEVTIVLNGISGNESGIDTKATAQISTTQLYHKLSGAGSVNVNQTSQFLGDNSAFTGQLNIAQQGVLTVTRAQQLGAGSTQSVVNLAGQLILQGFESTDVVAQQFIGEGTTTIQGGNVAFTNDNHNYKGKYDVSNQGTLTISEAHQIGSGEIALDSDSTFNIVGDVALLSNQLTGNGTVQVTQTGSVILTDQNLVKSDHRFNVDGHLTLQNKGNQDYTFNQSLLGQGQVTIVGNRGNFVLGDRVGTDFAGRMTLTNTLFTLDSTQKQLNQATLELGAGSQTTVTDRDNQLQQLELTGGNLLLSGSLNSGESTHIKLNHLKGNSGAIHLSVEGLTTSVEKTGTIALNDSEIFTKFGNTTLQFITAEQANDLAGVSILINDVAYEKNNAHSQSKVTQQGIHNANVTFGYQLDQTKGLSLTAGALTSLELLGQGDQAFTMIASDNQLFRAQIIGNGDLRIGATAGKTLTLGNSEVISGTTMLNNYQGNTTVTGGTVKAVADQIFGLGGNLQVANNATVDFAGKSQTIQQLANEGKVLVGSNGQLVLDQLQNQGQLIIGDRGVLTVNSADNGVKGFIDLAQGTLIVKGDSLLTGLLGSGALILAGGISNVESNHRNDLTATIEIQENATLNLNQENGVGQGNINLAGTLNLGSQQILSNQLSGKGSINVNQDVVLKGESTAYTGQFNVAKDHTLTASQQSQLGSGSVQLADNSALVIEDQFGILTSKVVAQGGDSSSAQNGKLHIQGSLTLAQGHQLADNVAVEVDQGGELTLLTSTLSSTLKGNGQVTIDLSQLKDSEVAPIFNFGRDNQDFKGSIVVNSATITFDQTEKQGQQNIATVKDSHLILGKGGNAIIAGETNVNAFSFADEQSNSHNAIASAEQGRLIFNGDLKAGTVDGRLNVLDSLNLSGGTVVLNVANLGIGQHQQPDLDLNSDSIFTLGSKGTTLQFIASQKPSDSEDSLLSLDGATVILNGQTIYGENAVSDLSTTASLYENGILVADAIYQNQLTTQGTKKGDQANSQASNQGLFLTSQLSNIAIRDDKTLTIKAEKGIDDHFTTSLTGRGNATFDASHHDLILAGNNSYQGNTTIAGSVNPTSSDSQYAVIVTNSNAFGQSERLEIAKGGTLQLGQSSENSVDLTITQLTQQGTLDLNGNTFTVTGNGEKASTIAGVLMNGGIIEVADKGKLSLQADAKLNQTDLKVSQTGTLLIDEKSQLDSAKLQLEGQAEIAITNDYHLNNKLTGNGQLTIKGQNNTGQNKDESTLQLGEKVGNEFKGTLILDQTALDLTGEVLQESAIILNEGSQITVVADSQHSSLIMNDGALHFSTGDDGNRADGIIMAENIALNGGAVKVVTGEEGFTPPDKNGKPAQSLNDLFTPAGAYYQLGSASAKSTINQKNTALYINDQDITQGHSKVEEEITLNGQKLKVTYDYLITNAQHPLYATDGNRAGIFVKYGVTNVAFENGLNNEQDQTLNTDGGSLETGEKDLDNSGQINTGGGSITTDGGNIYNKPSGEINTGGGDIATNCNADKSQCGQIDNAGKINTGGGNLTTENGNIHNKPEGEINTEGGNINAGGDGHIKNQGSIHTGGGDLSGKGIENDGGDINTAKPDGESGKGGNITAGGDGIINRPDANGKGGNIVTGGGDLKTEEGGSLENSGNINTALPGDIGGNIIIDGKIDNQSGGQITTGGGNVAGGEIHNKGNINTANPNTPQEKGGDLSSGGDLSNEKSSESGKEDDGKILTGGGDIVVGGKIDPETGKPILDEKGQPEAGNGGNFTNKGGEVNTAYPGGKGGDLTVLPNPNCDANIDKTSCKGNILNEGEGTIKTGGGNVNAGGDLTNKEGSQIDTSQPNAKGGDINVDGDIVNQDQSEIKTGGGQMNAGNNVTNEGSINSAGPKDESGNTALDANGKPIQGGDLNIGGSLDNGNLKGDKPGTIITGGGNINIMGKPNDKPLTSDENALNNQPNSTINTGNWTDGAGNPQQGGDLTIENGSLNNQGSITTEGGDLTISQGGIENKGSINTAGVDKDGKPIVGKDGQPIVGGDLSAKEDINNSGSIKTGGGNVTTEGSLSNNEQGSIETDGGNITIKGDITNKGGLNTDGGNLSSKGNLVNNGTGEITTKGGNIEIDQNVTNQGKIDLGGGEMTIGGNLSNQGPTGDITIGQKDGKSGKVEVNGNFNNGGVIDLDGGNLVINGGGSSTKEGGLKGDSGSIVIPGSKTQEDNIFTVKGKNEGLGSDVNVEIKQGQNGKGNGHVVIDETGNLGQAGINNEGILTIVGEKSGDNAVQNNIKGQGQINITPGKDASNPNSGNIELSGDNSNFEGNIKVEDQGNLIIRDDLKHLGGKDTTVDLEADNSHLTLTNIPKENGSNLLDQTIKGQGDITLNDSNIIAKGDNSEFAGSWTLGSQKPESENGGSLLTVSKNENLGNENSVVNIGAGSTLVLDQFNKTPEGISPKPNHLNSTLKGDGTVSLVNTDLDYQKEKAEDFGGNFVIDENSHLKVQDNSINNALSGKGQLTIDANQSEFNFGDKVGSDFAGTVNINNGLLTLNDNNSNAVSKGTLNIGKGSDISFEAGINGDKELNNMSFSGGQLTFNNGITQDWAQMYSNNLLMLNRLDLSGQGSIVVAGMLDTLDPSVTSGLGLIELNIGQPELQLIKAEHIEGGLSQITLTLQDQAGLAIENSASRLMLTNKGIQQDQSEAVVAEGVFDYGLTTGAEHNGLYVSYQLQEMAILENQTAIIEGSDKFTNNLFKANITDKTTKGNLEIRNAGQTTVVLSGNNSYSGTTTVHSGGLQVVGNKALGQTKQLDIMSGAFFDLNGTAQTVGGLRIESGAQFIGGGTLTHTQGKLGIFENTGTIRVGSSLSENSLQNSTQRSNDESNHQQIETPASQLHFNASLQNKGAIHLDGDTVGNRLTIEGNYQGVVGGASLHLNAIVNGGQSSTTDRLIIKGQATGETTVHINVTGKGGILDSRDLLLIETGGSTKDAFKASNNIFLGSYQYFLNQDRQNENWYLTSRSPMNDYELYRSDLGINFANSKAVLHTQVPGLGGVGLGGSEVSASGIRALSENRLQGNDLGESSIWNITKGGKTRGMAGSDQLQYDNKYESTTLGGDHRFYFGDQGIARLGLMLTTMKATTHSKNIYVESIAQGSAVSHSNGKVSGQAYGLYGTWYFNSGEALTPYVDGLLSYGNYRNSVETHGNSSSSYRSHVWNITVQGGYPFDLGNGVALEPQGQLTYLHYHANSYNDAQDTEIQNRVKGNVIARAGLFVYPTAGEVRPYAGLNVWYDSTKAVTQIEDKAHSGMRDGLSLEFKTGVSARLQRDLTLSLDTFYRKGKQQSKHYGGAISLKYQF